MKKAFLMAVAALLVAWLPGMANIEEVPNQVSLTPHAPIHISGNQGFTEENGVIGGSGTEDAPYIIEGWEITATDSGISIENTDAHFIIRNCRIRAESDSTSAGIRLESVKNARIQNCDIELSEEGGVGIRIVRSQKNAIVENHITGVRYSSYPSRGIHLTNSSENVILRNTITRTGIGIYKQMKEGGKSMLYNTPNATEGRFRGRIWRIGVVAWLLAAPFLIGTFFNLPTYTGCHAGAYDEVIAQAQGLTGWVENHSYPTTCAEEDNVNLPIFSGQPVKRFRVVATNPTYDIGDDNCAADFSGCSSASSGNLATATVAVTADPCTKLWDDGINVVLVCTEPDWWRPYRMNVAVGSQTASGHRLVLHRKIQDEDSWPEFLVLYEGGNLRLKPHPPKGRPDVCFGSSVILGPATPDKRPYVDIQEVKVYPAELSLDITYRNGETTHGTLAVDRTQALVEVAVGYTTSAEIPFATFRSMWVEDGNADVDHIEMPAGDLPILGNWTKLEGPWWFFHRTVRSRHNTSAPDIRVELVE
jgi:parallel beta-helix repeat protein